MHTRGPSAAATGAQTGSEAPQGHRRTGCRCILRFRAPEGNGGASREQRRSVTARVPHLEACGLEHRWQRPVVVHDLVARRRVVGWAWPADLHDVPVLRIREWAVRHRTAHGAAGRQEVVAVARRRPRLARRQVLPDVPGEDRGHPALREHCLPMETKASDRCPRERHGTYRRGAEAGRGERTVRRTEEFAVASGRVSEEQHRMEVTTDVYGIIRNPRHNAELRGSRSPWFSPPDTVCQVSPTPT